MSYAAVGDVKFAVPTWTARAPQIMNSSTSVYDVMPPSPMMGILIALKQSQTILSATGFTQGPDIPPLLLASIGLRVFQLTAIPESVLISETAAAPPASAARALSAMFATFGDSLVITGFLHTLTTAAVTFSTDDGSTPNAIPPCLTLGQEMLSSTICACASLMRSPIAI